MDNTEQIEYWNETGGAQWVQAQTQLDAMLAPLSDAAIAAAAPKPGERVIDIGCGCGATTLELAASGASVWGVDISAPMLAVARTRAQRVDNVAFAQADAATQSYTPDHDLIFSRFGVMFFADPVAAFKNMHGALNAEGRMLFICWQAPRENPWMAVVGRAVQPFLSEVGPPPDPLAPGPFAFADAERVSGILTEAGFSNIGIEGLTRSVKLGDTLDEVIEFQSQVGPLARGLADLSEADREKALHAARAALEPYITEQGISLDAACWLVSARH